MIISFPFAGGNKYSFQIFSKNLSHFNIVEYPGRGMRINEKLVFDVDLLIDDLLHKVKDGIMFCEDYIIYGHSMGSLMGYLVCQKIEELGLPKPIKLVVSGRKPPSIKREKLISHLPDNLFWEEVVKMGGIPDELLNHHELIDFYTPILKADFTAIEKYIYVKKDKLTIPIDVFYGSDEEITEEEIKGWEEETIGKVTITELEGNHFFIFSNEDFFINYFNNLTKSLNLSTN